MLIAETEYRYQVEEDIKPFRDVLLGLFFVTVGMALDLHVVVAQSRAGAAAARRAGARQARADRRAARAHSARAVSTALRTGFYLAQAGEFALVMLALAAEQPAARPRRSRRSVLAAMILSMLSAPLLIQFAEPIVRRLHRERLARARGAGHADRRARRWRARTT